MKNVQVDCELLEFDPQLDFNHKFFDFPLDTEIISVDQKENVWEF